MQPTDHTSTLGLSVHFRVCDGDPPVLSHFTCFLASELSRSKRWHKIRLLMTNLVQTCWSHPYFDLARSTSGARYLIRTIAICTVPKRTNTFQTCVCFASTNLQKWIKMASKWIKMACSVDLKQESGLFDKKIQLNRTNV